MTSCMTIKWNGTLCHSARRTFTGRVSLWVKWSYYVQAWDVVELSTYGDEEGRFSCLWEGCEAILKFLTLVIIQVNVA